MIASENNLEITVVDAIMGSGKTSAAINYMEEHCDEMNFLFITPYLEEIERIKASCRKCRFKDPKSIGTKLSDLKRLLKHGENIVTTHALFYRVDAEVMELFSKQNYILIMDEVVEVLLPLGITRNDVRMLSESNLISLRPDKFVEWTGPENYTGTFWYVKYYAENKNLIWCEGSDGECDSFCSIMKPDIFKQFKKVVVLTYLFEGSLLKAYLDLYGFKYTYCGVISHNGYFNFGYEVKQCELKNLKSLINIWISDRDGAWVDKTALSYSWLRNRNSNNKKILLLKKSIASFYRSITKTKSHQNLWTTFNHSKKKLTGPGYAKGFEVHNARSTNKHRGRTAVVYAANKFLNPGINSFFLSNGIEIDQDKYALSSMLQFIWRSAIRDGEKIWVYIPSERMRGLFENWLVEVTEASNVNDINRIRGAARKKVITLNGCIKRKCESRQ